MKKVFLILLNWNSAKTTVNCLESLKKINLGNFELEMVVADNGSTDGSQKVLRSTIAKELGQGFTFTLIENKKNLGFAEGNNVGIRYALEKEADYVCLLNNDTRVSADFLLQLVKVAEKDDQIGIVGGKIYFEKGCEFHKDRYKKEELGKVIWYAGGKIDWKNVYPIHVGVDEVDVGQYDQQKETEYVNGCLMLIKKEVFNKIGLLDSKYFAYFEENDFCQKAKKAGFKLIYTPKSIIWHLNASSSAPGSFLHDYFLTRNRLLFGVRWAPLRSKAALIKESLRLLFTGRKWQKIGIRDFYLGKLGEGSWNE